MGRSLERSRAREARPREYVRGYQNFRLYRRGASPTAGGKPGVRLRTKPGGVHDALAFTPRPFRQPQELFSVPMVQDTHACPRTSTCISIPMPVHPSTCYPYAPGAGVARCRAPGEFCTAGGQNRRTGHALRWGVQRLLGIAPRPWHQVHEIRQRMVCCRPKQCHIMSRLTTNSVFDSLPPRPPLHNDQ